MESGETHTPVQTAEKVDTNKEIDVFLNKDNSSQENETVTVDLKELPKSVDSIKEEDYILSNRESSVQKGAILDIITNILDKNIIKDPNSAVQGTEDDDFPIEEQMVV